MTNGRSPKLDLTPGFCSLADHVVMREAGFAFNTDVIEHRFCRTCGIHPYGEGTASRANRMAYINIPCLEDLDLGSVPVVEFDGRSM